MHEDLISSVGLHHTMTLEVKQRERKKEGAISSRQQGRKNDSLLRKSHEKQQR